MEIGSQVSAFVASLEETALSKVRGKNSVGLDALIF